MKQWIAQTKRYIEFKNFKSSLFGYKRQYNGDEDGDNNNFDGIDMIS